VAIAARAVDLLSDLDRARSMGEKGRAWVEREWSWEESVAILRRLVAGPSPDRSGA
jgi:phosphatidylinositol alpha-1,6-mannosyltransferase